MFLFIFLCMLFCHIVDDFYLQGILAKMKQKSWWQEQTVISMYQKDWLPALIAHGMSWSFMIMLPCNIYSLIYKPNSLYYFIPLAFTYNVFIHCWIDNLKCNRHTINLITDQICHLIQIVATFLIFLIL